MKYQESEKVELKRSINKDFVKEIVAFLNTRDGIIYIGVNDDGSISGVSSVDETMKELRKILRDQILLDTKNLCEIGAILEDDKPIVYIKIKKGNKLFYIRKHGRSQAGCFYRDGSSSVPISDEEIEKRWQAPISNVDLLKEKPASYSPLTFRQLKIFYDEVGITLNDETFASNLGLLTDDGQYNKIAELLADKNHIGFIYARYNGKDKSSFSETVDFGNRCLLTAVEKLMHKLEGDNRGITKITATKRITKNLVDLDCLREIVYNALAHNDWLSGGVPSVYVYEDRIEVISYGGLPFGQTRENFYKGISKPRSEGFIRILRDLDFAERTGHGIPQVIDKYGEGIFNITDSFILVTLPYDKEVVSELNGYEILKNKSEHPNEQHDPPKGSVDHPNDPPKGSDEYENSDLDIINKEKIVISMIKENPYVIFEEAANKLDISVTSARRIFRTLRKKESLKVELISMINGV